MFKILILRTLYNLADEAVDCQIHNRLSVMRFLSHAMIDSVADRTSVWRCRRTIGTARAESRIGWMTLT